MITFNGKSVELLGDAPDIRPDGINRTSVVQPTANYAPIIDGERVARKFASSGQLYPETLQGLRFAQALGAHGQRLQLLGLRDTNQSVWARLRLFFQGLKAKSQAASIVKAAMTAPTAAAADVAVNDSMAAVTSSLPSQNQSEMTDGGSPAGANSQQGGDALAIIHGAGTLQPGSNPPIGSNQQYAGFIAPDMVFDQPSALASIGLPNGPIGRQAYNRAMHRFYAANKGRIV